MILLLDIEVFRIGGTGTTLFTVGTFLDPGWVGKIRVCDGGGIGGFTEGDGGLIVFELGWLNWLPLLVLLWFKFRLWWGGGGGGTSGGLGLEEFEWSLEAWEFGDAGVFDFWALERTVAEMGVGSWFGLLRLFGTLLFLGGGGGFRLLILLLLVTGSGGGGGGSEVESE